MITLPEFRPNVDTCVDEIYPTSAAPVSRDRTSRAGKSKALDGQPRPMTNRRVMAVALEPGESPPEAHSPARDRTLGSTGASTPLPLLDMYARGVTFHVSRADSRRFLPDVVRLVVSGAFDPLATPTAVVDWDEADRAWLEPATKLVIRRAHLSAS